MWQEILNSNLVYQATSGTIIKHNPDTRSKLYLSSALFDAKFSKFEKKKCPRQMWWLTGWDMALGKGWWQQPLDPAPEVEVGQHLSVWQWPHKQLREIFSTDSEAAWEWRIGEKSKRESKRTGCLRTRRKAMSCRSGRALKSEFGQRCGSGFEMGANGRRFR